MSLALEWEQVSRPPQHVELEPVCLGDLATKDPFASHDGEREKRSGSGGVDEVDLRPERAFTLFFELQCRRERLAGSVQHTEIDVGVGPRAAIRLRAEQVDGADVRVSDANWRIDSMMGSGAITSQVCARLGRLIPDAVAV